MTGRTGTPLYTPDILALAVELSDFPLGSELERRGDAVSRVCGSRIVMGFDLGEDGRIVRAGAQVAACAIGQAAAALCLKSSAGCTARDFEDALPVIEAWLAGEGAPTWPGLAILEPARAHPARHGAILLPWKAALAALSMTSAAA